MANKDGIITRKDIIEDEALKFGEVYAENIQKAIDANKVLVGSVKELNKQVQAFKVANSQKDYITAKQAEALETQKAINAIKEQEAAEISANKVRLSTIATLEAERKAKQASEVSEIKLQKAKQSTNKVGIEERLQLQETRRELTLQAKANGVLSSTYDRLNAQRTIAQKRLGDLLASEKSTTAQIQVARLEFDKLDARVKAVDAALKNYSKNIGNYGSAFEGLNETAKDLISTFGLLTGVALFGQIIKDAFNVIREFDRQLIAVGKTTNISGEELKNFGKEVVELGEKTDGVSIDGLLKSSEVAGQLGVTGTQNILKFSTAIEKLKLTSDIISDEQVGDFAKFIEVSKDSFENADRLASVITQLGNAFATTEAEVLSNATEIQKGVSIYNASAESVLGLGAATASLGSEADTSRTAIQTTFKVIDKAVGSGTKLKEVLKLTGLTQKELSEQFNKDATGVFVKFVGGLAKAKDEGKNLNNILENVGITELRATTVIGALASNYDVLKNSVSQATEEYKTNAALNKEVEAASQSISSILGDIKDKWDAYILSTDQANDGTKKIATALKFLRDNLGTIIEYITKYGSVLLTYYGIMKLVSFVTTSYTAIKTAASAAELRFALATGIGRTSVLAQAAAVQSATVAQTGLNTAMMATPWGIILAAIAAAVVAYQVFNDELSETEIRVNAVKKATQQLQETEKQYTSERDKRREEEFKKIEYEIELRKKKGESSKQLDDEEINKKKELVEAQLKVFSELKKVEIERTKNQIEESNKRVEQAQKEYDAINKFALRNPFGESPKDKEDKLIELKANNDALKASLKTNSEITVEEQNKLNKILQDLDKQNALKNAEFQKEESEKQKKAREDAYKKFLEARKKRWKELYDAEKKANDDAFKLAQFRLQKEIEINDSIVNNQKATLDEKLDAIETSNQKLLQKNKEALEYELKNLGKYNEDTGKFVRELSDIEIKSLIETGETKKKLTSEQQLIWEKYQYELTKIADDETKRRQAIIDSEVDAIQKKIDAELQLKENSLNQDIVKENDTYSNELANAQGNFALIEKARKDHEKRLFEIQKKYALEGLNLQIKALEQELERNDSLDVSEQVSAEKRAQIVADLERFKREASDLTTGAYVSDLMTKEEKEREFNEKVKEMSMQLKDALVDFTNAIFDGRIQRIDEEIARNDEYYAKQMELAGNDQAQKDLLAEEAEKKRKKLEAEKRKEQRKQAIFNKAMAALDIGVQTGLAIVKAVAASPTTGGLPFSAIAAGIGALQLAAVLAKPIPKYKGGRKSGPEELAYVGDGGVREVIERVTGAVEITPATDTLVKLNAGDKVHSSVEEYNRLQRAAIMASLNMQGRKSTEFQANYEFEKAYGKELLEELKRNTKATEKNKQNIIIKTQSVDIPHAIWKSKITNWS